MPSSARAGSIEIRRRAGCPHPAAGRRGRRPLHEGRGLLQFCGVQRRKALQIILLLFTTLKTTPNPISPERRNAPRSTTMIHYSLLFISLFFFLFAPLTLKFLITNF